MKQTRTKIINLRLSEIELTCLKELAHSKGMTVSGWLRHGVYKQSGERIQKLLKQGVTVPVEEVPPVVKPVDEVLPVPKVKAETKQERQARIKAEIEFNKACHRQMKFCDSWEKDLKLAKPYLTSEQATDYENRLEKLVPKYPRYVNGKEELSSKKEMVEARKLVKEMKAFIPGDVLFELECAKAAEKEMKRHGGGQGFPDWMSNDPQARERWRELAIAGGKSAAAINRAKGFVGKQIKKANPKTAEEVRLLIIDYSSRNIDKVVAEQWEDRVKQQYINRKVATGDFSAEEARRLPKKPRKFKKRWL
jgi:hypothetical protein